LNPVFRELCESEVLQGAAVILFLNKRDIFAKKIKRTPLTVCFADYKGANDYKPTSQYIRNQFVGMKLKKKRKIYPHITWYFKLDSCFFPVFILC
jgi:hypothetical protein